MGTGGQPARSAGPVRILCWGTLINLVWCSLTALAAEAVVLTLRKRPLSFYLKDGSALVTALLLALALPTVLTLVLTLTGTVFAIVIGKQLYGGMGYNPFNRPCWAMCSC